MLVASIQRWWFGLPNPHSPEARAQQKMKTFHRSAETRMKLLAKAAEQGRPINQLSFSEFLEVSHADMTSERTREAMRSLPPTFKF